MPLFSARKERMTSNSVINPQGGIIPSSSVLLAAINPTSNSLYVMVLESGTLTMVQALDSNGNLVVPSGDTILAFTVTNVGESLVFASSSGQLTYSSAGTLTLGSSAKEIFFVQGSFQNFERPVVLTSGVMYIPYGDATTIMKLSVNVSGTTSPQQWQLIPAPLNYYQSCSTPDNNAAVSDIRQLLRLIQCSYSPSLSYCAGLSPAWTDETDCFNGNSFSYCSAGVYCTNNCKSECQSPTEVCVYQGGSVYACEPATAPEVIITQPPAKPASCTSWFWILMVFIIILVIGALVVAYYQSAPTDVYADMHSTTIHSHEWVGY